MRRPRRVGMPECRGPWESGPVWRGAHVRLPTWQVALRKLAEALLANSAAVAEAEAKAQAEAAAAAKAKAEQEADQAAAAAQLAAELAAVEAAVSSTGSLPRSAGRPPLPPRGRSSSQMMRHATLTPEAEEAARQEQQAEAARQAEPPPPPPPPRSPRKERQPSSEALSSGEGSPMSPKSLGAAGRQPSKKSFVIKQVADEKGVLRPLINEETGAFQMASMEAEQLAREKEEVERLALKAKTELEKQARVAQEAQERAAALAAEKAKAEAELTAARQAATTAQDKIEVLQAELVGVRRDAAAAAMQRESLRAELAETQAAAAEAGAIEAGGATGLRANDDQMGGLQSGAAAPAELSVLQQKLAEAEEEKAALRRALEESQQQLTSIEVERWQFSVEGARGDLVGRAPSESDASETYSLLDAAAKQVAESLQDSIATQEAQARMLELELEAAERMAADAEAGELDAGEVEEARAEVARLQKQIEAYEAEEARRQQQHLQSPLKWFAGVGGGSKKVQQPPAEAGEGDSGSGEGQQGLSVIGANVFRSGTLHDLLSPRFPMCIALRKPAPTPQPIAAEGDAAPEPSVGVSDAWQIADDDCSVDAGGGVATGGSAVVTPVQETQRDWVAKQEAKVEGEDDEDGEPVATVTAVLLPSNEVDAATEPKPKQPWALPPRRPSAGRGSASPWASTLESAPVPTEVADSAPPPPPPRRTPTKDVSGPPRELLMGSQSL